MRWQERVQKHLTAGWKDTNENWKLYVEQKSWFIIQLQTPLLFPLDYQAKQLLWRCCNHISKLCFAQMSLCWAVGRQAFLENRQKDWWNNPRTSLMVASHPVFARMSNILAKNVLTLKHPLSYASLYPEKVACHKQITVSHWKTKKVFKPLNGMSWE